MGLYDSDYYRPDRRDSSMSYLDETGLSYFWAKISSLFGTKEALTNAIELLTSEINEANTQLGDVYTKSQTYSRQEIIDLLAQTTAGALTEEQVQAIVSAALLVAGQDVVSSTQLTQAMDDVEIGLKQYNDSEISDAINSLAEVYTPLPDFETHVATDKNRWQDYYSTKVDVAALTAMQQGLKMDTDNLTMLDVSNGIASFTITPEYGGMFLFYFKNENGNFATVKINGVQKYSSEGIVDGIIVQDTLVVNAETVGDVYLFENITSGYFIPFVVDLNAPIYQVYNNLSEKIVNLQNQILDLKAGIDNKTIDGQSPIDIQSAAGGGGYTVVNELGGRLVGQGVTSIGLLGIKLISTGRVSVNGVVVYDNTSLVGVGDGEILNIDVNDGDIITTDSNMSYLTVTNYVVS